jgi:hypothetical protein
MLYGEYNQTWKPIVESSCLTGNLQTAVTQRLLEHASPQLTNDVYTNVGLALRQAINLLPMADWL